jgi:hypothetical protein
VEVEIDAELEVEREVELKKQRPRASSVVVSKVCLLDESCLMEDTTVTVGQPARPSFLKH